MSLAQNYVHFHWSMFWELTIAFSNPSCPTLKFWFWLTSNFLKTRFFQKAHFKGPWKARSKGLANEESKNLLLISPGLLSEKVEVEEKSAQPQLFDQGHLQFYRNLFFEKIDIMHLWRALSTCLANMQSNVILLVLPGLHSEKIECELKKVPNPNFFAMAHLQFSQNSFFQKTDIMHYWRALSMGLANKQSNVILLFLLGLHSEKIECELKKSAQPQLFAMAQLQFSQNSFFQKTYTRGHWKAPSKCFATS